MFFDIKERLQRSVTFETFDHSDKETRDGISVKNSTVEYLSPKIAHKMRISRHIVIRAKTA